MFIEKCNARSVNVILINLSLNRDFLIIEKNVGIDFILVDRNMYAML